MKIGNKITREELDKLKKSYSNCTIGHKSFVLGEDLTFEEYSEGLWELVSTRKSRIDVINVGGPIKLDNRNSKHYYG